MKIMNYKLIRNYIDVEVISYDYLLCSFYKLLNFNNIHSACGCNIYGAARDDCEQNKGICECLPGQT